MKEVFDYTNHLNKYDLVFGNFYWHTNKIINAGSFSTFFLGEDKYTGLKVAILRTEKKYDEQFNNEKYILQKIHNKGSFPLYMKYYSMMNITIIFKV